MLQESHINITYNPDMNLYYLHVGDLFSLTLLPEELGNLKQKIADIENIRDPEENHDLHIYPDITCQFCIDARTDTL